MNIEEEISQLKKGHWPSYSRGLQRIGKKAVKDKQDLEIVLEAAKIIGDPYYRATTLASLALEMKTARLEGYMEIFSQAQDQLEQVDPEWRRAEALEWVSGKMAKAKVNDFSRVVNIYYSVRGVERAKEAAKTVIKNIAKAGSEDYIKILDMRLDDPDRLDLTRAVANEMAKTRPLNLVKLDANINKMKEAFYRSKAWGYLGLKMGPADKDIALAYFDMAIQDAKVVDKDSQRLEIMNYLADNMSRAEVLAYDRLLKAQNAFTDMSIKARFLAHLAGKMSDSSDETSLTVFDDAVATCAEITEPMDKAKALLNVTKGMKKSGLEKYDVTAQLALECAKEVKGEAGENLVAKIKRQIGDETGITTTSADVIEQDEDIDEDDLEIQRVIILGLYNTYDKTKLAPAHVRAIARAAPLCWAYNLNLALINFPFEDVKDAVETVTKDTQVGQGGKFIEKLEHDGRIHITDDPKTLGELVATTSHPDKAKRVEDINRLEGDLCVLLGVGKVGLSRTLLNESKFHLEFTGKGIPLETCTAMGILANILGSVPRS